ncbi:Methanol dehydrogenase regulatory protein, partial [human gut metagenome]
TSGIQPPQPVPALVSAFSAATVWQPLLMAAIRSPLVTSKQEQICALSGSLSTPIDGLPLPECAQEIEVLTRHASGFNPRDLVAAGLEAVASPADLAAAREQVRTVGASPEL